jgi:hypothetical protein
MGRDPRDYKQFLRELTPDKQAEFLRDLGGNLPSVERAIDWVSTEPGNEHIVCQKIRGRFGVDVLTAAERAEQVARVTADATAEAARASVRSANAAERSAAEATRANATAERALKVAQQNVWAAAVAGLVALLALVFGLLGYLK